MLRKEICAEIKAVAGKERTLEFIGSTESVDRVGDVIEAAGWQLKNYKVNPVFLWAHDYRMPPIGKATRVWKSEGKLKFQIEFADAETYDFADTIFRLYKGGFLNAVSVGFEPIEHESLDEKGDSRGIRYKKQDLLELSAVPVPANAEALMNAREQGVITVKELESVTKPEETEAPTFVIPSVWTDGVEMAGTVNLSTDSDNDEDLEWSQKLDQESLKDEIDFLRTWVHLTGMEAEVKTLAWELVREIVKLAGDDMPDDITMKIGAVLSKRNRSDLEEAKERIDDVLASEEKPKPEDNKPKTLLDRALRK